MRNKNLVWIAAVLLLAFAGDRVGGFLLDKMASKSQFRYSRLYNGGAGCDVLLLGNSRGLIFYQPAIEEKTGATTTNLSYNGMPMHLAAALAKDHIEKNGAPKLLLLDVSLLDKRMDDRLVTGFNFYAPRSERLTGLLRDSFPNDLYAGRVTHLYRFNSEVFQRAFYYLNKSDEDWLLDRVISPTLQKDAEKLDSFRFDFHDKMLADLNELVVFAQQKNIRVELVLNPYFPSFAQKIANKNALLQAVEKRTGIPVRDYSYAVTEVDGFGDYQHLNKKGAGIFIEKLIEDGVLRR